MSNPSEDVPKYFANEADILRLGLTLAQAHHTPGIQYKRNGKQVEELADEFDDICTCVCQKQCHTAFVPQDHFLLNEYWYKKLEEALAEDDNGLFDDSAA